MGETLSTLSPAMALTGLLNYERELLVRELPLAGTNKIDRKALIERAIVLAE